MYINFFKRILDFLAALLALMLFSPIFILVTIGLFFANQGKPFSFKFDRVKTKNCFELLSSRL